MTRKVGRPNKAALAERQTAKDQWHHKQDQWRQKLERAERCGGEQLTWGEFFEGIDDVRAMFIVQGMKSPALRFVMERMDAGADPAADRTQAQVDAAFHDALHELLLSDIPLDRGIRRVIADAHRAFTHPDEINHRIDRVKVAVVENQLAALQRRGETRESALQAIAKPWGHASGQALHKWLKGHEGDTATTPKAKMVKISR